MGGKRGSGSGRYKERRKDEEINEKNVYLTI